MRRMVRATCGAGVAHVWVQQGAEFTEQTAEGTHPGQVSGLLAAAAPAAAAARRQQSPFCCYLGDVAEGVVPLPVFWWFKELERGKPLQTEVVRGFVAAGARLRPAQRFQVDVQHARHAAIAAVGGGQLTGQAVVPHATKVCRQDGRRRIRGRASDGECVARHLRPSLLPQLLRLNGTSWRQCRPPPVRRQRRRQCSAHQAEK